MGIKPLRIWLKKIDWSIKTYDEIRYLVLFVSERYNPIYNRIRYLISEKSGFTDSINPNFASMRINSYNPLPISKIWTFHSVIILIKSDVNKNKNDYYYKIFLEKGLYVDKSNTYFLNKYLYIMNVIFP